MREQIIHFRRWGIISVALAAIALLLAVPAAMADWENAQQVDNQGQSAGAAQGPGTLAIADGANGTSSGFFEQSTGQTPGYYGIRRPTGAGTWSPPQAITPPANSSASNPMAAAADPAGDAIDLLAQQTTAIFASVWPAGLAAPTAYHSILQDNTNTALTDPAVAFDSAGNGYAVAGHSELSSDGPMYISTCAHPCQDSSSSSWTPYVAISSGTPPQSACPTNVLTPTNICGREPRLAVSPDGTVVIVYLQDTHPTPVQTVPAVFAVRAPAGSALGASGYAAFGPPMQISSNTVPTSQGPNGTGTEEINYDVAIDGADNATVVDVESQSGLGAANSSVFATRWTKSADKPAGENQISASQMNFPPEPPAADPRVVADPSGDVTAAWTESSPSPNPSSSPSQSTIVSNELLAGGTGWQGPNGVSASTSGPGGGADAPASQVPPFALAEDPAGTAVLVWTDSGNVMWSARPVGGGWVTPAGISGGSNAVNGTVNLSAGPKNQADALWIQTSNGRNAVFASRFSGISHPGPAVTGVDPNAGTGLGGTVVRITGNGFTGATAVNFGQFNKAQSFTVDSDTQITATSPPGPPGAVDVTVTTPSGTSPTSANDKFTYQQSQQGSPTVTNVNPNSGPTAGGTTVTISGTNFSGAQQVMFGSKAATKFTVDYDKQITAVAPAGSGTVDVTVMTMAGTSATGSADKYTYVSAPAGTPVVSGVSPSSGSSDGGTSVTIAGSNLTGATAVKFGANAAKSFTVGSASQIVATSPAGSGTVDVTVTTPNGTSATSGADRFTYTASPPSSAAPNAITDPARVISRHSAVLLARVNPNALGTAVHFEYGLDSRYRGAGSSAIVYDQRTRVQSISGDTSVHGVTATVSRLLPNAVYHFRVVASNSDGVTNGDDVTFTTRSDPAPHRPVLGRKVNLVPVNGVVFVRSRALSGPNPVAGSVTGHGFVALTDARQLPVGAVVDARFGSVRIVSSGGGRRTNTGTFSGAIFRISQSGRRRAVGLTTLRLVEGAFKGAPSFSVCNGQRSSQAIQRLQAIGNGKFQLVGRRGAGANVGSASWSLAEQCNGTLIAVASGGANATALKRHKTRFLRAGQRYLAGP